MWTVAVKSCCVVLSALLLQACGNSRNEPIRIVGSSTVFPFSRTVAERFSVKTGLSAPVIEVTGTGAGFKRFCSYPGAADISNASRRIKQSEIDLCAKNKIGDVVELQIGYDGIVLATSPDNPLKDLTLRHVYLALAREIPTEDGFTLNSFETWSEIDSTLPDIPILVHGPPPTSGTRDAFVELAMEGGAKSLQSLTNLHSQDKHAFAARAGAIREDGVWIDEGENDNAIIQIIRQSDHAIGVFGFSFYDQNQDLVSGVSLSGIQPSFSSIKDRKYPLARSLFFYVSEEQAKVRPEIREFALEFVSEASIGEFGYLAEKGLIPLQLEGRQKMRNRGIEIGVVDEGHTS